VTPAELGELFETFHSSAFRLETLPEYRVPQDVEPLQRFRAGEPPPASWRQRPWLTTVRDAVARGARMQRVRVVPTPLTEYIRFQFAWGYPANNAAGEDIAILDYGVPGLLTEDYWLFDDALVVRLDYDHEGRFLRPVVVEDAEPYRRCRNLAVAHAMPFGEYLEDSRVRRGLPTKITDDTVLDRLAAIMGPLVFDIYGKDEPRPSKGR
jgi:hypothetical protein